MDKIIDRIILQNLLSQKEKLNFLKPKECKFMETQEVELQRPITQSGKLDDLK